jgi:hypothetical protein
MFQRHLGRRIMNKQYKIMINGRKVDDTKEWEPCSMEWSIDLASQ